MSKGLLSELPMPSVQAKGWPWTEETTPELFDASKTYPKISIVTPSYNQCSFLEETLRSILLQNYPNVELIVIDGGSDDGTIELLNKYDPWITYWVSEPDRGQSNALNKGFQKTTGSWVGWQNSDDIYYPEAFAQAMELYKNNPNAEIIFSNANTIDADSQILHRLRYAPFNFEEMKYSGWGITNQACFFSRSIINEFTINEDLNYTMDADFYWRIADANKVFVHSKQCWGAFRRHEDAKSSSIHMTEGWREYKALRARFGVEMTDRPWDKQYRLKKLYYKLRKGFYYCS